MKEELTFSVKDIFFFFVSEKKFRQAFKGHQLHYYIRFRCKAFPPIGNERGGGGGGGRSRNNKERGKIIVSTLLLSAAGKH